VDLSAVARLEPDVFRAVLPAFLAGYVDDPEAGARNRERMAPIVAALPDDAVRRLLAGLATLGDEPRLYAAVPEARAISRTWCRDVIPTSEVVGAEHLAAAVASGPALVMCNHLSYIDTTATDAVLAWAGHADLADRLVAIAGPKVYEDAFRRFAALCLNTLPAPQSTQLEGTARLSPRELAKRALESIGKAHQAMAEGYVPLLYGEGSRTRTGRLRPFLKGVQRYLAVDGLSVVPAAVVGTEELFPVDRDKLRPATIRLSFGPPIRVGSATAAREALEAVHASVAALLPPERRPEPGDPAVA
jgi:1-acyl-sn-glycerol-3-phosphate acyltransferase